MAWALSLLLGCPVFAITKSISSGLFLSRLHYPSWITRTSKVTIEDIADRAGVSKATVSQVLNRLASVKETKRDAVRQAMKEMGYRKAHLEAGIRVDDELI